MLPVSNLLVRIISQLKSVVERSGFTLVDATDASVTSQEDVVKHAAIQMICYRKLQPGEPTTLLELCHLHDQNWITATLWRPEDLTARKHVVSVDEVALYHQSWSYDQSSDLAPLAGAITEEITCWLDRQEGQKTSSARRER